MSATGNERTKPGRHRAVPGRKVSVERLKAALLKVAYLVARDPAFTPIFERLEAELALARKEFKAMTEAQQRAKSLLDQNARPARSSALSRGLRMLPCHSARDRACGQRDRDECAHSIRFLRPEQEIERLPSARRMLMDIHKTYPINSETYRRAQETISAIDSVAEALVGGRQYF